MKSNLEIFRNFCLNIEPIEVRIERMSNAGQFGDNNEIILISNVLHHEIYIYQDGNENPIIFCPFAPEPYDGIIKIIYNGVTIMVL